MRPFDLVFCRNGMVHFDAETKMNTLREFRGTLSRGGWLLLGRAQSALGVGEWFERRNVGNATVCVARQEKMMATKSSVEILPGELANMIGGNLKCAMMAGIELFMPSVIDGSNYRIRVCGAGTRESLAFVCAKGVFWFPILSNH